MNEASRKALLDLLTRFEQDWPPAEGQIRLGDDSGKALAERYVYDRAKDKALAAVLNHATTALAYPGSDFSATLVQVAEENKSAAKATVDGIMDVRAEE